MTRYLLDTNILSELATVPGGELAQRVSRLPGGAACTSIIVVAELHFGLAKNPSPQRANAYEQILSKLEVLAFDEPQDAIYGEIRAHLERAGTPIGANDLLIAAQAVALGLTIVTDNDAEFRRVPGLTVENWLRADVRR